MEPTTTSKVLMFWLAVTCIAIAMTAVVPLGSAEETQDLTGCIKSLASVGGCVKAIKDAIEHKVYDGLKHECCTAIVQLSDNCWPILYPDQPYVPIILKSVCKLIEGGAKGAPVAAPSPN